MTRKPLAGIVAGVTMVTLAACGHSSTVKASAKVTATPSPTPTQAATSASAQQLTALLLATGDLPAGYSVHARSMPDGPAPDAGQDHDCGSFIDGYSFVDLAGAASAGAAIGLSGPDTSGSDWNGVETMLSYSGDGAHATMDKIRSSVDKCPNGTDPDGKPAQFGLAAGAGVGDESLTVTARTVEFGAADEVDNDVTLVRRGNVLIVVEDDKATASALNDSASKQLLTVAKLADDKFTHAMSRPG